MTSTTAFRITDLPELQGAADGSSTRNPASHLPGLRPPVSRSSSNAASPVPSSGTTESKAALTNPGIECKHQPESQRRACSEPSVVQLRRSRCAPRVGGMDQFRAVRSLSPPAFGWCRRLTLVVCRCQTLRRWSHTTRPCALTSRSTSMMRKASASLMGLP